MKTNHPLKNGAPLIFRAALLAAVFGTFGHHAANAADGTWTANGTTGAWLSATNWSGSNIAGGNGTTTSTDLATFGASPTGGSTISINMTSAGGNYSLGAIDVTSLRTSGSNLNFNNTANANSGVLTVNGLLLNGFNNVFLSNNGTSLVNINNGTNATMDLALGNSTDNVVLTLNSSAVAIASNITGTSRNLSLLGGGAGSLTLSGTNSYTGNTTVGASKTLIITGGSTASSQLILGAGSTVNFSNAATFINNAVISGSGTLNKTGAGTLVLGGNNTGFSGNISFTPGAGVTSMLRLNDVNALGTGNLANTTGLNTVSLIGLGAGDFTRTIGTGASQYQGLGSSGSQGFVAYGDRTVNFSNSGTTVGWTTGLFGGPGVTFVLNDSTATGTLTLANGLNLGTSGIRVMQIGNGSATVDAVLSGNIIGTGANAGGMTYQGGGTVRLDGAASTYLGATTISAGTTVIATTLANGGTNSSIGAASAAAANLVINGGTLRYSGGAVSSDRSFTIGDGNATIEASGTGNLTLTSATPAFATANAPRSLTLGGTNSGTNTFQGVLADNGTGALSVTKANGGTWALSGVNTYTGTTTVSAGTLILSDNAELRFAIGSNGVNNQVNGSGNFTIDGDFRFNLTSAGTTIGNTWSIVTVGTLTETFGGTFSVFSTNGTFTNAGGGIWTRTENSASYQFSQATGNLSVVPEPSTWLMLAFAGVFMVVFRKRRAFSKNA